MGKLKITMVFIVLLIFLALGTANAADTNSFDNNAVNDNSINGNFIDFNLVDANIINDNSADDIVDVNGVNDNNLNGNGNSNKENTSNNDYNNSKDSTSESGSIIDQSFSTESSLNVQNMIIASTPVTYIINNSNYNDFFYNNGSIKSGINAGDTLYIQGTLTNKNFIISIPLNIITTKVDGKLVNCTITIINTGSGSNITNLTFNNSNNNGHGVHLTGTQYNKIENCTFTLNGLNAYSIPVVRSNYNKIIGNTIKQTPNNAGQGQTHSLIVLGDSHYNVIENNTLESDGSNCIYLCTAAFADFSGSKSSTNNNISGNIIYGVSGDWCWAIAITNSDYNNIKNNKVRGAQRGISVSGNYINITGNDLQSKGTSDKPGIGISASGNHINIINNYINQSTNNEVGIEFAGTNSSIRNNTIFTINGYAIQVSVSENITLQNNSIATKAGKGISIFGTNNLILIENNYINSTNNGVCIMLDKASNSKFPKNVIIKNNKLNTTGEFAVDAKNADDSPGSILFEGQGNVIYGNGKYRDPNGVVSIPNSTPIFDGESHYVNESNYDDYFTSDGTLTGTVNDRDILIISGNFYNKNIIINRVVKIEGNGAYFYNTTFKIIIDGARIDSINIINSNNMGIIIVEANNVEINYCNITLNHTKTAYGIWISKSDNAKIKYNRVTVKGDFLTFGIFLDGANNCTIQDNIINVTGTKDLYNHHVGNCTECDNGTCVGGTCTGGTCVGGTCVDGTCTGGTCVGGTDDDGTHIIPEIYRTYGIILIGSDNNKIINNRIYATSALENPIDPINDGQNSIVGIDIYYDSHNNEVIGNIIEIIAKDPFLYGMGVLGSPTGTNSTTAKNNIFKNNRVTLVGPYFVSGFISGQNSYDTIVSDNTFECWGGNYSYGITLEKSQLNTIANNTIRTSAIVNYAIEAFESNYNIISNNNIESQGSYSYGIALYASSWNSISYNIINVNGNRLTTPLEGTHHDAIPYGNTGILLIANSNGNNITNNSIISSGEYAINCTNTSGNKIVYNFLNTTDMDGKKGKDSVSSIAGMNVVERNYYHSFEAIFSPVSTEVNGTANSTFPVSSQTGDVNGAKVKFYVFYEGTWTLFNESYITNGFAGFNWNKIFNGLNYGVYQIKAVIIKDGFEDYTIYSNLTVNKAPIEVIILNSTGIKGGSVKLSAKVTDKRNNSVSNVKVDFYVNGFYVGSNTTNSEGIAVYNYIERKGLNVGSYNLKADALVSSNHLNGSNEGIVKIKDKSILTFYSIPSEIGKISIIQAVLKNSAGKALSSKTLYLIIGNKVYLANTTSNGIATFGFSGLNVGKTKFVILFVDDDTQGSCNVTGYYTVKNHADLIITHVKKSGNYKYKITVKNQGESTSKTSKLKIWFGKKYKIVKIGSIDPNKSKTINVNFFKYSTHKKYTKYVEINYNKAINETNYKNNKISFKTSNYQRFKADLTIKSIKRSGNKYIITIKNQGTADSGKFRIKIGYGKKEKIFTVKSIPKGKQLTQKFTFFKYSTHKKYTKYVNVNYNKAVVESNYKNNLKKFKV
ncbi:hypothetical protein MARBORIA2_08180 [Methanobrevibacter arboriphilus]|jgi:hypothetical protein|uniref:Uncharacterized protein n=1 Tax=Methanobrevibacter arboriphilus TaxID=39441 RepID=A0ACA8R4T4_METAZ|nr:right-handed parallel beta-helix repeat-containing protein [Methanobrevibacter arboriphilus]BBL62252.1 hypothetical protein MarbSA_12920 [Methanobrevibacter arboriphilus]GLI11728.1 hypothetical protein MARBORIA2_08180 [Methanobrevibacter arboriphilus]